MLRVVAAASVFAILFAGCSDSAPPEPPMAGLQATATTGILLGVVVDDAIRPLADAHVELAGPQQATARTDAEGTFGFSGLPGGTYVLKVTKAGFFDAQLATRVEVAEDAPPLVHVQLVSNLATRAYHSSYVVEGYIECGSSLFDPCATVNFLAGQNLTNDRSRFSLGLSSNASLVQTELIWESTQALAPQLGYGLDAFAPGCDPDNYWVLNHTQGESPLLLRVNDTLVREQGVGGLCPLTVMVAASGPLCTEPMTAAGATIAGICPGMALQQRFTFYLHSFYNYLPPLEWRFSLDETVPPPPDFVAAATG